MIGGGWACVNTKLEKELSASEERLWCLELDGW